MTGPVGGALDPVGVAYADIRFRGDKAPKDVSRILDNASDEGNDEMEDIGDKWGDTLDKHLKTSTKNTGRDVARGISAGIEREGLRVTRETIEFDRDGNIGRRWVTSAVDSVTKAIKDEEGSGAFKKVGEAFTSAVGAGFNVSGRSPLIFLLIPLVGIIGELIGAAVQAAGALSALLFIIPNLVFAIGAEAGVLILAFQGIGEAISGAFAATNAEELQKALEGLTPAAQEFVKQLLPMKDLFNQLQDIAQQGFFAEFGNILQRVFNANSPFFLTLAANIGPLAESLGRLARTLVGFLNDPAFLRFVSWIIPQITTWLDKFGPSMLSFLNGLSNIGFALLPLFVWFGDVVNNALSDFGGWLADLSTDQDFLNWLEEVKGDLAGVWEVLKQAGRFLFIFTKQLNSAGGDKLVSDLATQLKVLANFLGSEAGLKAIEGMIHTIQVLSFLFTIFVLDVLFFFTSLEIALEWLKNTAWPAITGFFTGIADAWNNTWGGAEETFTSFGTNISGAITAFKDGAIATFTQFRDDVIFHFTNARDNIVNAFHQAIDNVRNFFSNLPTTIANAVGDLYGTLRNAGANLIAGLINGALSMLGPLRGAFSWLMQNGVLSFLPHSPAKEGPLSGEGDPMIAGATIVERIATGMEMEAPQLGAASAVATSNVLLGTGAVQMNFYGQTPTNAQAGGLGAAAGNSLATTLAQRNTRLAIRSIGAMT